MQIIVTGTRFQTPNASSPAPVTVVGAEDLLHQGTSKVENLLNNLPQVNAGLMDTANGVSELPLTGTATVDLRGIGAFRTLVLMNGNRINPGDAVNPSADLHTIPEILIKRVEVLTGGASSIYGSDAVAGVVNFVMDTDFVGSKLLLQGSGNLGSNGNSGLQAIEASSGINPPTGNPFDGKTINLAGAYGMTFADDAGHVEVYAGYRHNGGILASSRDVSACTLQETGSSYACVLDATTSVGQFVPYDTTGTVPGNAYTLAGGTTLRPVNGPADYYNPQPLTILRPDTRYNAGMFAQFSFNRHAEAYLEGNFTHDYTSVFYGGSSGSSWPLSPNPDGTALPTFAIPCNDPLLSASEIATICTANGLAATDTATVGIGRRNIEAGPLEDTFRHSSYRILAGLKGSINDHWSYDSNLQYGKVTSQERLLNDVSLSRFTNALDIVNNNGNPTCRSVVNGTDPGCVPYNLWSVGGVTPAAVRYITGSGGQSGYATQLVADAQALGDLGAYGLKSPWAADPLRLAVGAEYRRESISLTPDAAFLSGDLIGANSAGAAGSPTFGTFHVSEAFTEIKIPLVTDKPLAESLNLDLSDRYAKYHPQGAANAYNLGADWAPVRQVRFRTSYSRAIRAPNGHELFRTQEGSSQPIADPCAGQTPTASQAQCSLTGVTAAEYGHIPTATSVNVLSGGNPNAKPEKANTVTTGVVFTDFEWAPSLLLSVDYWRIRIKNYIGGIAASASLDNCISTGNPVFCNVIQRDAAGSLSGGNPFTGGHIVSGTVNTGSYEESGVDIAGQYVLATDSAGKWSFTFNGSKAIDNRIQTDLTAPQFDCTGLYGPSCSGNGPTSPIPRWRHSLRTTWAMQPFEVSLNWRFIGALSFEGTSAVFGEGGKVFPVDSHVANFSYFDLDAGYSLTSNIKVDLGVNNLLNKQPPVIGFSANPLLVNGNMLSGIYDPFGREIFAELSARF